MLTKVHQLEHDLIVAALDTARIGLCVFDSNGMIVMVNDAFSDKLNLEADQLVNQNVTALSVHDLVINNLRDLVALDSAEVATEGRYRSKDGALHVLLFQGRTLNHTDDQKYRVLSVVDITNYGITRDRYIELRRQLDALNSAVVIVDVHSERMPIIYANKRFEEMTGYSAQEAIGRNCRFLQGSNNGQAGAIKLKEAIENRQSCHAILENYKKDGSSFLNEVFISPVYDRQGNVAMYIGIQQEVNDRIAPFQSNAG